MVGRFLAKKVGWFLVGGFLVEISVFSTAHRNPFDRSFILDRARLINECATPGKPDGLAESVRVLVFFWQKYRKSGDSFAVLEVRQVD